jgi:amino acid adenylation domain-containing protein
MLDASCYVAFLPNHHVAGYFELPGDGPGGTRHEWSEWQSAGTNDLPLVHADLPAVLASFALLLWRWSGRDAFGVHLRLEDRAEWTLAAVRLRPAASWRELVNAWTVALEGEVAWPEDMPLVARAGLDLGTPTATVPDALEVHWHLARRSGCATLATRQRGTWLDTKTLAFLANASLQGVATTSSTCPLGQLPLLLLASEEAQWTQPANVAAHPGQDGATLVSRLAQLALESPERIAVESGAERLSYGALFAAARALSQRILSMAGPYQEAVGIMFPPGPQMLVAVYGTLLANKYYVPLDPDYPAERLAAMVADADPVLILADGSLHARANAIADGIPVLRSDGPAVQGQVPVPAVVPTNLAYVLYTSGSSGKPKGVMQSHQNVLFHGTAYGRSICLEPTDRVALLASLCFDASVMDIFGALMYGAGVYPFTPSHTEPATLLAALDRAAITVLHATPTLFRLLFSDPGVIVPSSIRALVLGGELVTPNDVAFFRRAFGPAVVLVNGYGPTESTMALQYPVPQGESVSSGHVPVGFPVPGVRATVGAPGAPWRAFQMGELFLHSAHLFLGYLNSEDETASRLVHGSDGRTYYRTGDLALRLPDGRIAVRGRVDQQMKFHGFRIEPGDIEAQLLAFPGIRQAAVRLGQTHGQDALLAYIGTGDDKAGIDDALLRKHLRAQLPAYMQPSRIVKMTFLPRTPSGKIDRLALPDVVDEADDEILSTADIEECLAGLWRQVLGRRPSRQEDFFAAGGHSLAALQLVGRIRRAFEVDLSLQQIFNAPSLVRMAADIGRLRSAALAIPEAVDTPAPSEIALAPVQRGLWYLHHTSEAAARAYNMQLAFRLHGAFEVRAFESALDELTARHATLRTGFPLGGSAPIQEIRDACRVRLRRHDFPGAALDVADQLVLNIAQTELALPFDLEAPPLMRVVFGCLATEEHYVVVTLHHLIADGWSLSLLLREFSLLYGAAVSGQTGALAPLTMQYTDYAVSQEVLLNEVVRTRIADFWRAYLDGAPPLLRWKAVDPAVADYEGGSHGFSVPADLKDALTQLGARYRATPFMTLLAIWGLQLAAQSGQNDFVVGTAAANRPTPETEQLIGLFVNSLPIRVQVMPESGFDNYLCRIRDACMAAFGGQELPFDELVRLLGRTGEHRNNPVFQVMLTLDSFGTDDAEPLAQLRVSVLERPQQSSHLDLALSFRPQGDGWRGTLTYARSLFSEREAEGLVNEMLALMRAVAAAPTTACAELGCAKPFAEEQEW